jgi:hypothetical protein
MDITLIAQRDKSISSLEWQLLKHLCACMLCFGGSVMEWHSNDWLPLYLQKTKKQNTQLQLTSSGPFPNFFLPTKLHWVSHTFNPVLGGGLCDFNPIVGTYFKCCVVLVSHNKIVIKFFLGEWQASRFWNYSSYCLSHLPSIHGTSN